MLNKIILGAPLWLWIIGFIVIYMLLNEKDSEKFTQDIEKFTDNKKTKVFNFNTLWCGWSKKFQPEWNKFTAAINSLDNKDEYEVKDIKCDDIENDANLKALTKKYKVQGYPHVVIENDKGQIMPYKGERTVEALYNHVKDL